MSLILMIWPRLLVLVLLVLELCNNNTSHWGKNFKVYFQVYGKSNDTLKDYQGMPMIKSQC